jgi:hypothetical protein
MTNDFESLNSKLNLEKFYKPAIIQKFPTGYFYHKRSMYAGQTRNAPLLSPYAA